jgi:hypothetical protein
MLEPPATTVESAPVPAPAPSANGRPATAPGDVAAPADLAPQPVWWERLAWYAGAILLSCLLAAVGMKLWARDLRAPFYYDLDALLYLPLTRTVIEQGFWNFWHADRLGAPGVQLLYDFPIIDYLHFFFLWLFGQVFSDVLLAYNAYSLLTYPLTVLTAMWVLRWLKLSLPAAALGGLLYAFLPYHQERYHYHYFLAAYWWVPVSLVPAIALCRGDFPFFRRGADGQYAPLNIDWPKARATAAGAVRASGAAWKTILGWALHGTLWTLRNLFTWRALAPILIGAVTASAGAYYAFFACSAYAFAGVYAAIVHRTWRGLVSAALVIAPVFVTGVAYHVPTLIYHYRYGDNPITARQAHEADSYGLKVAHLLLPANDHNFTPFANLRARYANPARPADGESAGSLGIIGGIGLVALTGLVLLPFRRRWPEGPIAALAVYLILLGSIGSIGSLFNLIVSPQIRAYNRISVFIAFLSFFAVLWWVDGFLLTRTGRIMRRLRYPALAGMLILGYFDQTPWGWNPFNPRGMEPIDEFADRYRADKRFFQQVEKSMPPGAKVFCLPYSAFPESPPVHKMPAYEHARGFVMTDTLKWSFGAIKKREADAWQKDVSFMMTREPATMLRRIVAGGFDGVLIDGRGFPAGRDVDRAAALMKRFNDAYQALALPDAVGELPRITHEDGKQFFLDVRPFREAWREKQPDEYAKQEAFEREWVAPQWLAGYLVTDPADDGEWYVWGQPDTTMWLVNPTDRTRKFTMSYTIGVEGPGEFEMTFSGLINDSFTLVSKPGKNEHDPRRDGTPKSYTFDLPPGRSAIRIRCKLPPYFMSDERMLCYFLKDFKLEEDKSPRN